MQPLIAFTGTTREGDDGQIRVAVFQRCGNPSGGFNREIVEVLTLKAASPTVENLNDLCPCDDLFGQVFDGRICQKVDERRKGRTVGGFQSVCRALIRRPAACDHIGRNGPRCAGETDQRRFLGQFTREDFDRLVNRVQNFIDLINRLERLEFRRCRDRCHSRTLARFKPKIDAQGLRQ